MGPWHMTQEESCPSAKVFWLQDRLERMEESLALNAHCTSAPRCLDLLGVPLHRHILVAAVVLEA